MTRIEKIRQMPVEEMAKAIIKGNITGEFCKSDCDDWEDGCKHEMECCVRWLEEVVEVDELMEVIHILKMRREGVKYD